MVAWLASMLPLPLARSGPETLSPGQGQLSMFGSYYIPVLISESHAGSAREAKSVLWHPPMLRRTHPPTHPCTPSATHQPVHPPIHARSSGGILKGSTGAGLLRG